jgi:spermidine synthase
MLLVGISYSPFVQAANSPPTFTFRVSSVANDNKISVFVKNTGTVTAEQVGITLEIDGRTFYASLGPPLATLQERGITARAIIPSQRGTYPVYITLHYYLEGRRYSIVHVAALNNPSDAEAALLDAGCSIQPITLADSAYLFLKRSGANNQRLFFPEEVSVDSSFDTPAGVQYNLKRGRDFLHPSYQVFEVITSSGEDNQAKPHRTRICPATLTVTRTGPPTNYVPLILLGLLTAGAIFLAIAWVTLPRVREKLLTIALYITRTTGLSHLFTKASQTGALGNVRTLGCAFFFVSGAAALIYEVIWVRILGLIFGNTTYAVTTVLATYMAGLGLGSFLFGRAVDRWTRPLRAYGLLEIGLGLYAALTLLFVKIIEVSFVFLAHQVSDQSAFLVTARFFLSALILFLPTLLMGGTLPVLIRFYIGTGSAVGASTGLLYGINTAGAVVGTFLAGFVLIPKIGLTDTLGIAVLLNVGVGSLAWFCSRLLSRRSIDERSDGIAASAFVPAVTEPAKPGFSVAWLPYGLFVSGALAMVYEVAWTRVFALLVGSSTYAFSLMLTTFLLGLALGSYGFRKRFTKRTPTALEWALFVLVISLFCMATLPYYQNINIWSVRIYALTIRDHTWFSLAQLLLLSLFMFIPSLCFGAIFPLSVALYTKNNASAGHDIGYLYLANTLGNIAGSLLTGFLFISLFGIYFTFVLAIVVGGLLAIAVAIWFRKQSRFQFAALLTLMGLLVVISFNGRRGWQPNLMATSLIVRPEKYLQYTKTEILNSLFENRVLYYREGLQSIVGVVENATGRALNVNGKTDASTQIKGDMTTQLMIGHLPHLLNLSARKTLVIGFGSGVTLASVLAHPVNEVTLVEIEPSVRYAAPFFQSVNRRAYLDPRVTFVINDARNYLLTTQKRFDVIASEPSNPWMAGVGNLFTQEFYRMAKQRLTQGGVFCQWLQKYDLSPQDYQMVVATVRSVFPFVAIWRASIGDALLIAAEQKVSLDIPAVARRFERPLVKADMRDLGIFGPSGLLSYFVLGVADVNRFVEGARINTDNLPFLEFEAPKTLHNNLADSIEKITTAYRTTDSREAVLAGDALLKDANQIAITGLSYFNLKDISKAKAFFNMALKNDPKDALASLGLGMVNFDQKAFEDAGRYFSDALTNGADSLLINRMVGLFFVESGQRQLALPLLDRASVADATDWEIVKARVTALVGVGKLKEALPLCRYLMQFQPLDLSIVVFYARIVEREVGPEAAIEVLEKLRRDHPTYYLAYQELKRIYESLGKIEPPIAAYEDLVANNPYNYQVWKDLIALYLAVGDEEKINMAMKRASEIYPNFAELLKFGAL